VSENSLEIRSYRAGDEAGIIDCLNRALEKPYSLEEWSWRFPPSSRGRPILIAVRGGRVLAHVAATPARLQIDDQIFRTAAIESGVVDPSVGDSDTRRGLLTDVTAALISELSKSGDCEQFFFLGAHKEAAEWAAIMEGASVDLPVLESLRRAGSSPSRIRRLAYRAEPARDWEPRLGDLWQRAYGAYQAAIVRDPEHSLARYSGHPSARYHRFLVFPRFSDRAVAFAVFRSDEGMCRWVDFVWDHRHPGAIELLGHVSSRLSQQTGAETEEVWLAGDPEGRRRLGHLGFVEQSPAERVGLSVRAAAIESERIQSLGRLFLTMGDLRSR
jgi:hypothetical protein